MLISRTRFKRILDDRHSVKEYFNQRGFDVGIPDDLLAARDSFKEVCKKQKNTLGIAIATTSLHTLVSGTIGGSLALIYSKLADNPNTSIMIGLVALGTLDGLASAHSCLKQSKINQAVREIEKSYHDELIANSNAQIKKAKKIIAEYDRFTI